MELKILTTDTMIEEIVQNIQNKRTPSVENTHFSRTLQLIVASGHEIRKKYQTNRKLKGAT